MKGLVWGYTFRDGINKLKEIEANYNYMGIESERRRETKNEYSIQFANGDYWRVVLQSESSRGYKANISYVDTRISPDFVNCVIRHCTYLPPYNAIKYFDAPCCCWSGEDEEIETNLI